MKAKLIGSKITKIEAERNPDFSGKLSLSTNINIKNIEKFKPENSNIESLKIDASFKIEYGELGKVIIEGQLFLTSEDEFIENVLKNYNENDFKTNEMVTIMNLILQKFSIKAFDIEDELGLPIHIRLPTLEGKKSE